MTSQPQGAPEISEANPAGARKTLSEIVEVLPDSIAIPLPKYPTKPDEIEPFMDAYRVRLELAQSVVALEQMEFEREKVVQERTRLGVEAQRLQQESLMLDAQRRKFETEHAVAEIDLANAKREQARALALPDQTLIYPFFEEVSETAVREAINTLGHWSKMHPGADMEIQISTAGGTVLDGLALYDYILILRGRGHKVKTVALGCAASMGTVLLQAGDERVMGANAFIMMHEVSYEAKGRLSEQVDAAAVTAKLQSRVIEILCDRSTLTSKKIQGLWRRKDHWSTAAEALKLGLIDRIE